MTTYVLVHGAFRGGWSWERVLPLLRAAGHEAIAPDLSPRPSGLSDWADEIEAVVSTGSTDGDGLVLVGHSQGGIVVREVAVRIPELIDRLVYLDAAVPDPGERAVDVGPVPVDEKLLPPRDTLIPPTPLTPAGDLDAATAAWINERLVPTPFAPSLDTASTASPQVPATYAFCADTPETYPSATTRRRLDERGTPYRILHAGHDAPLTCADAVAELLLATAVTRTPREAAR